jgi:uncharacterized protein (DUF305 family)
MTRFPTRSMLVALLAATVAACGTAARMEAQPPHHHPAGQHGTLTTGARLADGSHPWTEADVRFMSSMIGHHAQAIQMSQLAPTHGASPAVQRLAARIINAQQDEIAAMQLWLRDRGQPVPEADATHHHGADHAGGHAPMPGMLTPEQMAQLDRARGPEFDRLFLSLMIQHHRGAVSMVTQLFGSYGAAQDETVFKFASDVNVDQTTEIERMRTMLADLMFGSPSPR